MIRFTDSHSSYPLFRSEIWGSYFVLEILMCIGAPVESLLEQAGLVVSDQAKHLHESGKTIKLLRP